MYVGGGHTSERLAQGSGTGVLVFAKSDSMLKLHTYACAIPGDKYLLLNVPICNHFCVITHPNLYVVRSKTRWAD